MVEPSTNTRPDFLSGGGEMAERIRDFLFMDAPALICVLRGPQHVIELANKMYLNLIGNRDIIGKPIREALPEGEGQHLFEVLDQVYSTGEQFIGNEVLAKIDKGNGKLEDVYFNFVYQPYRNSEGEIEGIFVHGLDVTEQVGSRKKIEQSEKKFEAAILAVEGIIWTNNANGEMIGEQPGWANLTGQRFEEYQGYGWAKAVHPDDVQPTLDAWNEAVKNKSTFEFEHRVKIKQNGWRLFSVKAVPALGENGIIQQWVGVHTDITEEKLAREKLAYRTALLEAHNEANVDGILLVNAKGKILSFNQRFVEIWNMPQDIVNAKDDDAALSFAMKQLVNPQQFIDKVKYLYEHPTETSLDELEFNDGKIVERHGYPVIGEDGTYYAWSWTFKDITQRKKIEQDLKNTKEQLELSFKNIPAGVYLINEKGEMIYVNDRGAAVYGDFTPEYILEQKDLSTLLKIADELFERYDENGGYFSPQNSPAYISLTTGKPSQTVLKQINKATGEQRWYYVQGAPLFDGKGNVSLVLITSTDITEQKNAEEKIKYSEERFRSLAQTLPQLVWITDAKGNLEFTSVRWKEYTGIEPGGEKEWKAIVHPDDYDNINAAWLHCLTTGNLYNFDVRLKSKTGQYKWHAVKGEPVVDQENKIVKWVGAFTDIHEQKLKDERKDEFISIASHELKTPLTTVKGYLQMLELTLDENNPDANLFAKKASQSVTRLNELIGQLLDVSKIRLGKLNYTITTFDFNEMVDSTVENMQLTSPTHTIVKTGKVYGEVTGDKDRLQQVLINLLTNAIKYSPNAKKVFINAAQQNDMINISVKDTGIGIAKQSLHKIFDRYHRIEEHAAHFQGLGIGLFISYEIIQRHHGKLWAESEPGKGSTFHFTIPLSYIVAAE